mgnify:CR=1 FL=1
MQTQIENISFLKKCKICGNTNLKNVLFINEQYISATFVKTNKDNNLTKIRTPLTLVLCSQNEKQDNCGLLQLLEITKAEGKPEQAWDKIVEGRLTAWYKESVLLEQGLHGDKTTVQETIGEGQLLRFEQAFIGE